MQAADPQYGDEYLAQGHFDVESNQQPSNLWKCDVHPAFLLHSFTNTNFEKCNMCV